MKTVALGVGDQDVRVPAHVCVLYDGEPDRRRVQLGFLRPAIDDERQCVVLLGAPNATGAMIHHLETDVGRSLDSEVRDGRLHVAQYDSDADRLLETIRDVVAEMAARVEGVIRFFAQVAWDAPGFPLPEDHLWAESRINDILADTQVVMVCAYDVSSLPDRALSLGGLATHPLVLIGGRLTENPAYLAPHDYMRAYLLRLGSLGEESRPGGAPPRSR